MKDDKKEEGKNNKQNNINAFKTFDLTIPTFIFYFRLTFNIKWGNKMIWANNYGDDNMVGVGDE